MIVNSREVFFKGLEFVSKIETFFRFRNTIFEFRFMYETFCKSMKPFLVQYGTCFLVKHLLNLSFHRRRFAEHVIVTAAKIVGNNSDGDFVNGYEWCIEQVRNSSYLELASGLEIQKAIGYLREDSFSKVRRRR
jgi:hypothetical protein